MVHLDRITTRSGDDGLTALGDGTRVPKSHARVAAMGSLDELNAAVGLAIAIGSPPTDLADMLRHVQNDLFDAGAELCLPARPADETAEQDRCRITADSIQRLDRLIDAATARLRPLDSFVLPGGSPLAATLHLARTVCRRAERDVLSLAECEPVGIALRTYLNRLSDLLFVQARMANNCGRSDILWQPVGPVSQPDR